MRELSAEEAAILESIDTQLKKINKKLHKVQPLIDQKNRLTKLRAILLDEKSTTGSVRSGLSMEVVITYLTEHGSATVSEIADHVGVEPNTVRAHLNRHKDERYRVDADKKWSLIGKKKEKAE